MGRLADIVREMIPYDILTTTELVSLLKGSADSRYGVIRRALCKGELIQFRRGLYGLGVKVRRYPLNLFEIAQKIYYPSYVSCESALSYHGWIPEAVYTITSVSLKRSVNFQTTVGVFNYSCLPRFNLIGVNRVEEDRSVFFMASPSKAIIDYVAVAKKDWKGVRPLIESLRIEEENFAELDANILAQSMEAYRSKRVSRFVKELQKDLHL